MAKFLVVSAHPDDCDLRCGGLACLLVKNGHECRFLSITNGNAGHQTETKDTLRKRRIIEMKNAGKVYGIPYDTFDIDDGYLTVNIELRDRLIRYIRIHQPDVIITHRSCDYHPDHRATGQLVNDCSYLIGVPLICPDVPALKNHPVILSSEDRFTLPVPFKADIGVCCDSVIDQKIDGVLQHVTQVYEWLPYDGNWEDVLQAKDRDEKTKALIIRHKKRFAGPVEKYPTAFREGAHYGEVYQIDEYGGAMTDELRSLMINLK